MRVLFFLVTAVLFALPMVGNAEPNPCKLGGYDVQGTRLDIATMYKTADAVVVGEVTGRDTSGGDLVFQVQQAIKGEVEKEIILHGQRPINTEMNGFVLTANKAVLLFLKRGAGGAYDNVEDYNSPCNITLFVKEGKVVLIEHDEYNQGLVVALDKLKTFLEGQPQKLLYKYQ